MLNKVTLESGTDINQNVWDIESHDTVFKDGIKYINSLWRKESNKISPNNKYLALLCL